MFTIVMASQSWRKSDEVRHMKAGDPVHIHSPYEGGLGDPETLDARVREFGDTFDGSPLMDEVFLVRWWLSRGDTEEAILERLSRGTPPLARTKALRILLQARHAPRDRATQLERDPPDGTARAVATADDGDPKARLVRLLASRLDSMMQISLGAVVIEKRSRSVDELIEELQQWRAERQEQDVQR